MLHSRLRTKCSSLNQHLFKCNIVPSPLCTCGAIESVSHYFLECQRFTHQREVLVNAIAPYTSPTITHILFGDESLDLEKNSIIFDAVHLYIKCSKRFDTQLSVMFLVSFFLLFFLNLVRRRNTFFKVIKYIIDSHSSFSISLFYFCYSRNNRFQLVQYNPRSHAHQTHLEGHGVIKNYFIQKGTRISSSTVSALCRTPHYFC